jgi:hypothetical protein
MSNIKKLLEDFKDALYSDNYPETSRIHLEVQNAIIKDPKILEELHCVEYSSFIKEQNYMSLCLNYIQSEDWKLVKRKNDITVESRGSGNEFFTRCTVLIDADIVSALSVLSEIDLVTSWYYI